MAIGKKVKGFTLVELMIAALLSTILLGGLVQIFTSTKQTYRVQEGLARLQEGARFALEEIAKNIRMAGYTGCFSKDDQPVVNTLNGGATFDVDIDEPLAAFEANGVTYLESVNGSGTAIPYTDVPTAVRDLIATMPAADRQDIITIRSASNSGIQLDSAMPNSSADLKLVNGTYDYPSVGEIVFLSDCARGAVFQITNITLPSGSGAGSTANVVHNTGGSLTPGNVQKQLTNDGSSFDEDASLYRITAATYFVAPSALNNNQGSMIYSLWRYEGNGAAVAEELVAGVDTFQLLYGLDTNDDGIPERYVNASGMNVNQVVSVRIDLGVNSIDEVDINGRVIRHTFNQVIKLRNRGA